jgi:hypothetical protein
LKKPILHVVKYKTVCLQTEKRRAPPLGGASIDIGQAYTGYLTKNVSTHNFFIYYPISMNKKTKDMVFHALPNSRNSYLRLLHSNKTFGRGVVQVAEVFRILGSVKHCSRYPLETRQS